MPHRRWNVRVCLWCSRWLLRRGRLPAQLVIDESERGTVRGGCNPVDLPTDAAPATPERQTQSQTAPQHEARRRPTPSRQASGRAVPRNRQLAHSIDPGDADVLVNGRASGRPPLALRDSRSDRIRFRWRATGTHRAANARNHREAPSASTTVNFVEPPLRPRHRTQRPASKALAR